MTTRVAEITAAEADRLADRFEARPAEDVIAWAAERFEGRCVLTCSWQQQSSVLVHLVAQLPPELRPRIVELDTEFFFRESYATRDRLIERYGVEVETIRPERSAAEQALVDGPNLWETDPDRCCALRKVAPLERALEGADAWLTGIRREQGPTRAGARTVALDRRGVVKVQPLVDWDKRRVWSFITEHDIPYNPLHDLGFPSIGCMQCTRPVGAGQDERSGRWAGSAKTECGLHGP